MDTGQQPIGNCLVSVVQWKVLLSPTQPDFITTLPDSWELGTLIRNGYGRLTGTIRGNLNKREGKDRVF